MIFLSGCALMKQIENPQAYTYGPNEIKRKNEAESIKNKMQATLKVGTLKEDFIDAWGNPQSTEQMDEKSSLAYDLDDGSFIFIFENDKLKGWIRDHERMNYLQNKNNIAGQEKANKSAAWYQLSNTLNQIQTNDTLKKIEKNQNSKY